MKIEKHKLIIICPDHSEPVDITAKFGTLGRTSGSPHNKISKYVDSMGEDKISTYYKVGVVRNPLERIVSRHISNTGKFDRYKILTEFSYDEVATPYKEFFTHEGINKMDFFIKWDSFESDFNRLCDILDIENEDGKSSEVYENTFCDYYAEDEELICFLWDKYRWDIVSFSYHNLVLTDDNEDQPLYNCYA